MKIALLATTGAGKTAYLTGLYGELLRLNSNRRYGINFEFTNTDLSSQLADRYTKLLHGDFGPPTKQKADHTIKLLTADPDDNSTRTLSIEILDFPGEDLYRASQERGEERDEVIERLSDCDGFIVLLDGEILAKGLEQGIDSRVLEDEVKTAHVSQVLRKALARRREKLDSAMVDPNAYAFSCGPTAIAFALTKKDKVERWLADNIDEKRTVLEGSIREIFAEGADPDNTYKDDEGLIANFIRSQFGPVIDAEDVISIRGCVDVYDENIGRYNPTGLDHLFQFVLFTGLRNASDTYGRRLEARQEDLDKKDAHYESERRAYERAAEARRAQQSQGVLGRIWDALFEVEDGDFHERRTAAWHQDMVNAAGKRDSSRMSVETVRENMRTADVFTRRILSDKLVYLLTRGGEGLVHSGLPIADLAETEWWGAKYYAGQQEVERRKPPRAEPA